MDILEKILKKKWGKLKKGIKKSMLLQAILLLSFSYTTKQKI